MPKNRVCVYVDGFNMYHALDELNEDYLKWVNLWALSEKIIAADGSEELAAVKYFTAYATWREESMRRHQRYVAALKAHGVTVVMGRFKDKRNRCFSCGTQYISHEEKETDVNIGSHLMADALKDRFDRGFVVSADTDLNGVVALTRREAEAKLIQIVAPPGRKRRNREALFAIPRGKVKNSLLPERCVFDGREIVRPIQYQPPPE